MKSAIWLGFTVPDDVFAQLVEIDPLPAIQTHKFAWSFAAALSGAFERVSLISSCPVQSFPVARRIVFRKSFFYCDGFSGKTVGFINIVLLKHITRLLFAINAVSHEIKKDESQWLFIHGIHTPYLLVGLVARLLGLRVVVVLTDPPGVTLSTDSSFSRGLKKLDAGLVKFLLRGVHGVVSLSPALAQEMAPAKPSLFFPGIVSDRVYLDSSALNYRAAKFNANVITIVYAGSIINEYGIRNLLAAFSSLQDIENIRLIIYGKGPDLASVVSAAGSDCRISYGGFLSGVELMNAYAQADLLVNPRPLIHDFVSNSFPSKLLDYAKAGRPVLTTDIPSIPAGLRERLLLIEADSAEGIANSIRRFLALPPSDRELMGRQVHDFVLANYSEVAIGRAIERFIVCIDSLSKKCSK